MNTFILIITGILGATLTHFVSEYLRLGAVKASALLSLIVGLFFYAFPNVLNGYLTEHLPIVFVGTSFIGMVSAKTLKSYTLLAIAGALFTGIYITKSHVFDGYGGALGALAFIALVTTMGFAFVVSNSAKIRRKVVVVWEKVFGIFE
jgi:Sec-independent protein secretion pathway component TatC